MKKRILAAFLCYSGLLWIKILWLRVFGSRRIRILCYHRVLDVNRDEFYFNHELIDATSRNFEQQMQFLSKCFNVITFEQLAEYRKKGNIPNNSLIITFDDGYKDNYDVAYPILKKYRLPATIFLATDFIGNEKAFWWDELAYYIKKTRENEISIILNGRIEIFDLSDQQKKHIAVERITRVLTRLMKNNNTSKAKEIMSQIKESLNVEIDPSVVKENILTWDNVREMMSGGIEFGSHTAGHKMVINLTPEEINDEIVNSTHKIEQEISKSPIAFAFPAGAYSKYCIEALKKSGIEFGCAHSLIGINTIESMDRNPYALRRIDAGIGFGPELNIFKIKLCFPKLMGINVYIETGC